MTLHIDLPPDAEAKLRAQAAAVGKDVSQFVQEVMQRIAIDSNPASSPPHLAAAEQWDRLKDWMNETSKIVSKSLPRGTVVDDSRESIYAGRGE